MKIFIICPVKDLEHNLKVTIDSYVKSLEFDHNEVHLPYRDTDQTKTGIEICTQNMKAIRDADEVHIFYTDSSLGTHFDLGMSFAMNKKIKFIQTYSAVNPRFPVMISAWDNKGKAYCEHRNTQKYYKDANDMYAGNYCTECGEPVKELTSNDGIEQMDRIIDNVGKTTMKMWNLEAFKQDFASLYHVMIVSMREMWKRGMIR